ncbi:hypothetical protein PSTT_11145 [Puccinia striiformis]|uniref:Uncharacterized protein n=1 Tax=Puccinia striiformis TaxID=27350 RepID=A0A2S4V1K5_9BASI|nr:hypothetical protein PSTT_11145 [Puccinia striiformis]
MWDAARDCEKEEEDFLANIIAKMVLMIGKLDWEAFKWLLGMSNDNLEKIMKHFGRLGSMQPSQNNGWNYYYHFIF